MVGTSSRHGPGHSAAPSPEEQGPRGDLERGGSEQREESEGRPAGAREASRAEAWSIPRGCWAAASPTPTAGGTACPETRARPLAWPRQRPKPRVLLRPSAGLLDAQRGAGGRHADGAQRTRQSARRWARPATAGACWAEPGGTPRWGAAWPPAEAGQILPGGAHFGGDVPAPLVGTPEAAGPAGQEGRGGQCRTFLSVAQELGGVRRGPGQAPPRAPRHHPHALIAVHPLVLVLRPADELGGTGGCGGGRRPHISVRPEEPLALASGRPLSRPSSALGPRWSPRPVDTGGPRQLVWVLGRCGCHQVAKWTTPAPSFFPRHGARGAWL